MVPPAFAIAVRLLHRFLVHILQLNEAASIVSGPMALLISIGNLGFMALGWVVFGLYRYRYRQYVAPDPTL